MEQEIDVFEGLYPKANIIPVYADEVDVITSLLQDSVRLAKLRLGGFLRKK